MKKLIGIVLTVSLLLPLTLQARGLEIGGKSAVLMDSATGTVLYEKNAHEPLAPASVTKVMTMLLIMEEIDSGRLQWEDPVTVSETAAAKGGSQIYLKVGETMSVSDMVKSIAVSSANDCACAMAEHLAGSEAAFVDRMNEKARTLGMKQTHFVNCTGLDDAPEAREHRTTAYDIALMSAQLLTAHADIKKYTTIWTDSVRDGAFGLANTNKLVRFYPGCTGLKTGFTADAGFCLSASALRDGMELVAVVMGCETSGERFGACRALLDHGFANFARIEPEWEPGQTVPVKLGKEAQVPVEPAEIPKLLIEKRQKQEITTRLELEEAVTAPVSRGQRLGTLTVQAGEQVLAQIPLVAGEAVQRRSWLDLFCDVLGKAAMTR